MHRLAQYLVELRNQVSPFLTSQQTDTVISLWRSMDDYDKQQAEDAARLQGRPPGGRCTAPKKLPTLPGPEGATRCPSWSSNGPAQRPDCCGLVESLFTRLCRLHPNPLKRGKASHSRWSLILKDYQRIRQLVTGSALLMQVTDIKLVEVSQHGLVQWYTRRQRTPSVRPLAPFPPPALPVSARPLQEAGALRGEPPQAREAPKRQPPKRAAGRAQQRQRASSAPLPRPIMPKEPTKRKLLIATPAPPPFLAPQLVPPARVLQLVFPVAAPRAPPNATLQTIHPPKDEAEASTKRRYKRLVVGNTCKRCGRFRTTETGHSQYRGKVYCPGTEALTKEQWLEKMRTTPKVLAMPIL